MHVIFMFCLFIKFLADADNNMILIMMLFIIDKKKETPKDYLKVVSNLEINYIFYLVLFKETKKFN